MEEAEALSRARTGDREAFRHLVERHGRGLYRLAVRITGSETDAEDVVQDTFLRAFNRLHQFEERSAFGSWIYRVAANAAYDVLRSRKRRELPWPVGSDNTEDMDPPDVVSPAPGPERLAFAAEVRQRIGSVVLRMSAMERSAFVLRHLEGLSVNEIGETLGQSENSVKQSLFRAVQKLQTALQAAGVTV